MKIEIGKYIIENDRNFSIMLKIKVLTNQKHHKTKNKEKIYTIGYFANLEQVFNKMLDYELSQSEVKDLQELNAKLDELRNEFVEMKKYTVKSFFN